jgi:hypothetical protein
MSELLNREALLAKDTLEIVKVELNETQHVFVRQMTGHERDVFEQSLVRKNRDTKGNVVGFDQATEDYRAKIAVVTVCNEEGILLFKPNDYALLSKMMSAKKLEAIVKVAQRINAIAEEEKELLAKNSDAVPDGSSSSDSVEN